MVVVFIKTNIQHKMMDTTTMFPEGASHRANCSLVKVIAVINKSAISDLHISLEIGLAYRRGQFERIFSL